MLIIFFTNLSMVNVKEFYSIRQCLQREMMSMKFYHTVLVVSVYLSDGFMQV